MKIHNALLSKGYFPKELPPAFTTVDFGSNVDEIVREWCSTGIFKYDTKRLGKLPGNKKRRGSFTYTLKEIAEAEVISMPKKGYERRNIHIVHPLPQALLSKEIGANWKSIQKFLSRRTFSEDKIQIGLGFERSIKEINFLLHATKKRHLEATSNWVVTTDINRFYPSIYTHSIAWAAYGKERVKSRRTYYEGSLADRIDTLVRSCNRGQTIGIPVGPETSRILAEIISARIEDNYRNSDAWKLTENIDRLQDDWTIGVRSLEDAERVLSIINNLYRTYGLDINGSKTSIDHIVAERKNAGISEIKMFLSHRKGGLSGTRLMEFLDLTLTLQSQNPSDNVVKYTLSVLENKRIAPKDIPVIETFLIKSAMVAPLSLDRICRIILDLQHKTNALSGKRIGERFIQIAEIAIEKLHLFEVIWLLYTLRGLKQHIKSEIVCSESGKTQSAAIALILMDMNSRGLVLKKLPVTEWLSQISRDSIYSDWTWLMAYEGIRHGWLPDNSNLMKQPLFKPLISRDIVFYDPNRNISTSANATAKRERVRKRNLSEIKGLLKDIREVEIADYDFSTL